jgi:hypothetical protein
MMRLGWAGIPAAAVLAAFAIALGGCGDDEEPAGTTATTERTEAETQTETERAPKTETERTETTEPGDDGPSGGMTAPPADGGGEASPGGAGDEVPARSEARIEGRDGAFHPTVVRVPPFIAIRVELVSTDGRKYELEGPGGRKLEAGEDLRSASTRFPGLRAGDRLVLRGDQGKVTIQANAEPGP